MNLSSRHCYPIATWPPLLSFRWIPIQLQRGNILVKMQTATHLVILPVCQFLMLVMLHSHHQPPRMQRCPVMELTKVCAKCVCCWSRPSIVIASHHKLHKLMESRVLFLLPLKCYYSQGICLFCNLLKSAYSPSNCVRNARLLRSDDQVLVKFVIRCHRRRRLSSVFIWTLHIISFDNS